MNKNTKSSNAQKNTTVLFGYSLFALTVITVIISTVIPFTLSLFNPQVNKLNVTVLLVSLVAGAILPALITYILGDRATHAKNKTPHHYNGVLFGVAAYWLSMLFSNIGSYTVPVVRDNIPFFLSEIVNAWPIVATIIIMALVAVGYSRNQTKNMSVLDYRPYQLVLLTTVAIFFLVLIFSQDYSSGIMIALTATSLVLPILLIGVSYIIISKRKTARLTVLLESVVATSIGLISASLFGQLISYSNFPIYPILALTWLVCLLVWVLYLSLVARKI